MADIIAESGLSAGAIYGHFASKAEITREVAELIVNARLFDFDDFLAADPLRPPAELLQTFLRGLAGVLPNTGLLVQLWGEAITDAAMRDIARRIIERMRGAINGYLAHWHERERGLSQADAAALADRQTPLYAAACQGYILQSALVDDFDADAYIDSVGSFLPA
jgi:AcrR family transcriptional regulator